jgi:hypothetical protein
MDDTIDSNSNLSPWREREVPQDSIVTEMYNNTIDAGTKGKYFFILLIFLEEMNFDEIITFNHTYLKYRLFDGLALKVDEFPFLLNHEFLLAGKKENNLKIS